MRETPAEQGFHCFRGWAFWLLQGQWDRGLQELEGSMLGGGGYGEQVEAGLVVDTATGAYEEDHLISLEIGGAPSAEANLWPEPYNGPEGARVKDVVENKLHSLDD
jgi:hypothetical protein